MKTHHSKEEQKLVDHAKTSIVKYNTIRHQNGGIDTLYAFLLSERGNVFDGACYEPNIAQATICGERHAIANMILSESYNGKIKSLVIADPVPKARAHGTPPCGTCRHLIWSHGRPNTSVLLLQYLQGRDGWTFPKIEKYAIAELYPHPYEPEAGIWDGWKPE